MNAPIVLAHGLFGFRDIGVGRFTLTSYFRGIPDVLRLMGNRVLVTRVPPIAGVKHRSRVLAQEIEAAFPGEAFHVVGHSMGGLDARHLLADPAWTGRFLSLTTVGTPHLGSAIADCARLRVGPVYKILRAAGIEHRGFHDVTRRAARAVNRLGIRPTSVPCFSVAGTPERLDVCWPLRPLYDLLLELEGPNDGLVSAESALAFGKPLVTWPIDHLRQLNWLSGAGKPSAATRRAVLGHYLSLLENLAEAGFSATRLGDDWSPPLSRRFEPLGRLRHAIGIIGVRRGGVEQDGDGHVAEHVGRRPAAVEEPVDGHQHGDLVGR